MRRRCATLLLPAALLLVVACGEVDDRDPTDVDTTADVEGVLFLDLNGNGQPDLPDDPVEDWPLTLRQPAGGQVASTRTDTAGAFTFSEVPVGEYVLRTDLQLLGDTLELFGVAFEDEVLVQAPGVTGLRPGLTFPTVDLDEVPDLPLDRRVYTTGVALNDVTQSVSELHLLGEEGFLRATGVTNRNVTIGDSVRVLGRTAREVGFPLLSAAQGYVLGTSTREIVAEELSTAEAAEADGGVLNGALVQVRDGVVLEVEELIDDGARVVVDDGSGPVSIIFRPFLNLNPGQLVVDTTVVERARGLLVPRDDAGDTGWDLLPRTGSDYRIEIRPDVPSPPRVREE